MAWKKYSSEGSGVTGFDIGEDYIIVEFQHEVKYKYSYASAGADAVEAMKELAVRQKGLSTYIAQHNPGYAGKF